MCTGDAEYGTPGDGVRMLTDIGGVSVAKNKMPSIK